MGRITLALSLILVVQSLFDFAPQLVDELHIYPVRILFAIASSVVGIWGYSLIYLVFEQAMTDLYKPAQVLGMATAGPTEMETL